MCGGAGRVVVQPQSPAQPALRPMPLGRPSRPCRARAAERGKTRSTPPGRSQNAGEEEGDGEKGVDPLLFGKGCAWGAGRYPQTDASGRPIR